jgi:hypothetical protein
VFLGALPLTVEGRAGLEQLNRRASRLRLLLARAAMGYAAMMSIYTIAALSMWGVSLTFARVISITAAAGLVGVALVVIVILSVSEEFK